MVKLHFKDTSEFEGIFKRKNMKVTDAIVLGIEKAMQSAQTSAMLFSITFDDVDTSYEISLPKKEWIGALESCLKFYHEYEKQDEETSNKQIDTWKLLEAPRVW